MSLGPSIHVLTASRLTLYAMNPEFRAPVEWFMQIMYKTWMEGTRDKHNETSYFFVTIEPNRMRFPAKCREFVIISKS